MVIEDLFAAMVRAASAQANHPLASVRAHPWLINEMARWSQAVLPVSTSFRVPIQVLGLQVVTDEHLPRGVWRLCDGDGGLLWDCRSGQTLRRCLQAGRS